MSGLSPERQRLLVQPLRVAAQQLLVLVDGLREQRQRLLPGGFGRLPVPRLVAGARDVRPRHGDRQDQREQGQPRRRDGPDLQRWISSL